MVVKVVAEIKSTNWIWKTRAKGVLMNNIERGLNKILEEHQHESGLHVIGGQRKLVDRLLHFFEEEQKAPQTKSRDQEN